MPLKLHKPLILFDLETTGIDVAVDRIVEISLIKVFPDQSTEIKTRRINPTIPIPQVASDVHGITNEMVKECPTFVQIARSLFDWMDGADWAGFNSNRFDIPLLVEEFYRANIKVDTSQIRMVDVQNIFHKKEQRTLAAAYKFYCDKDIENAHSAEADIKATYDVLLAQIEKYPDLNNDVESLAEFSQMNRNVDLAGRIILDQNDVAIFNFGKFKGQPVTQIFARQPSYYSWMMNGEFSQNTKDAITKLRLQEINK